MATQQAVQKILRLGVIQNGRIIEERLLRSREAVTVGQRLKNTFVIASNAFPPSFTIFDVKGGVYQLQLSDQMTGRLLLGDSVYDLETLKASGKAKKTASGWSVELSDRARGKISLGDVTVLFQFVNPPPLKVLPQLPANMRGGILLFMASVMGLSGGFLASMIASAVAQIGTVIWLVYMVPPPQRVSGLDAMPDRFVQILEPRDEEPPETEPVEMEIADDGIVVETDDPSDAEPTREEPTPEAGTPTDTRARDEIREAAQTRVRQESALAAFYGGGDDAQGPSLGFTSAVTDRRGDEVLSSQTALGENSGSGGIVSRSGLGTSAGAEGEVGRAGVGGGGGSRVAEGATTERTERAPATVQPRIRSLESRTAGTGQLDQSSISSVLRRRQRDIERCYERGLNSNPQLRGRVLVQFTIGEGGVVTDARLATNEVGDSVGTCIIGQVRRWRFDPPRGGSVSVQTPYILEPSSN